MEYIIYLVSITFFYIMKKIYNRLITTYFLIILPYVVILFLNNHIATRFGFYAINEETQTMLLIGNICFFFGSMMLLAVASPKSGRLHTRTNSQYVFNFKKAIPYIVTVIFIRIIQLSVIFLRYGLAGIMSNDFELLLTRGPVAHLLLSIFPMMMVVFYKWTNDKKKTNYLVIFLLFTFLAFIETEKAQVISLVISTFIFCSLMDPKMIKKGVTIVGVLIVILFIGNYVIKLSLQGYASKVAIEYYTYRLWNYIAGGIINSKYVVNPLNHTPTNAFDYLSDCIFALPNMFTNKLFDFTLGANVGETLPYINSFPEVTIFNRGYSQQTGNVVSVMTMMWGNGNLFAFVPVCILWGIISEYFYMKMHKLKNTFNLMTCCCYMTFSTLSFFGSYYTLSSFYERLIMCWLISIFFKKYKCYSTCLKNN